MKTKLQCTVFLMVLALSACSAGDLGLRPLFGSTDPAASEDPLAALGKKALFEGNLGLAAKHYQAAVERNPTSIEALNGLAASYDHLGRFDLAQRYYDRALEIDPRAAQTLNNIGYSHLLQGKRDMAAAFFKEALAADRDNTTVRANLQRAEAVAVAMTGSPASARPAAADPVTAVDRASSARNAIDRPLVRFERETPQVQRLVKENFVTAHMESGFVDGNVRAIAASYVTAALNANLDNGVSAAPIKTSSAAGEAASHPRDNAIPIAPRQRWPLIEVSNGTGRTRMAARMRDHLEDIGIHVARLTNANSFSHFATTIAYRKGWEAAAEDLASLLSIQPRMQPDDEGRAEIRITLGADLLDFDAELRANAERDLRYAAR